MPTGLSPSIRSPAIRRLECGRCGTAFDCGGEDCWCAAEAYRLPMPAPGAVDCLCPACLHKVARATGRNRPPADAN